MRLGLILLLIHFAVFKQSLADQILTSHTGGTFGHGSREPKYNIEFHSEDSPFQPDDDQESIVMPGKDGKKYLCYLPKEEKTKSGTLLFTQNATGVIMESEKQVKLKTPDELLEVLKGRCFLRQEGWWSVEFCYHEKIRQFHVEDEKVLASFPGEILTCSLSTADVALWTVDLDTCQDINGGVPRQPCSGSRRVVQEYILGYHDPEATSAYNENISDISTLKDPRSKDASQRYYAHQYTNGTTCDLTNLPRGTEVRFVCSETKAMISSITELSTCKYALTVQCPMLCKHPLYQEERPVWLNINCNLLPRNQKEKDGAKLEKIEGSQIIMVRDTENPSGDDEIE